MSAILKYISRISLILLVLVSATSCTRWHEAKEVIAAADSLLAKGKMRSVFDNLLRFASKLLHLPEAYASKT